MYEVACIMCHILLISMYRTFAFVSSRGEATFWATHPAEATQHQTWDRIASNSSRSFCRNPMVASPMHHAYSTLLQFSPRSEGSVPQKFDECKPVTLVWNCPCFSHLETTSVQEVAGAACSEMGSHRVADVTCNIWLAALKRHDNKYAWDKTAVEMQIGTKNWLVWTLRQALRRHIPRFMQTTKKRKYCIPIFLRRPVCKT